MVAILLSLILSISSFASLQDCVVVLGDHFIRNYSYPRDVFYVSIQYQNGELFGYDPAIGKFTGYKDMEVIEVKAKKGEQPAWPFFENQKNKYIYVNPKGLEIVKYPPTAWEEFDSNDNLVERKYLTAYEIDCAEGKNTIRIVAKEPAVVWWGVSVGYEEWDNQTVLEYFFDTPELPEGLSGTFIITPKMGQREMVFYVDPDYKKIRIDFKVSPEMLMQALNGCAQLGLIKNQGILNSLLSKLQNADKQYKMGDVDTAKNIIRAFSNELSALEGKQIDQECVSALQMDVKAFLGVNIVQEGLEKFIKESESSGDSLQPKSVKSEGTQAQASDSSSSKVGSGCSMVSGSSVYDVFGWLVLGLFVLVRRFGRGFI
jgi:hypothetical protein